MRSVPMCLYLRRINRQRLLQQRLRVGGQAVVEQQVGGVAQGQVAVGRGGRAQPLAQALQGAAGIALGPPEQSSLVVELPARHGGLHEQTGVTDSEGFYCRVTSHSLRSPCEIQCE